MDFVVFGCGFGALLMLVGFALRDLGPWLFGTAAGDEALPEFEEAKTTIRKQTLATIGNGLSFAGAGIAVVTFAALLAGADDKTGAMVVGVSVILATMGVAAWSYDAYRRFRGAMTVVYAQERATRARRTGASKRQRPARQRPNPAQASGAATVQTRPDERMTTSQLDEPTRELDEQDEALLDWNSSRIITPSESAGVTEPDETDSIGDDEEDETATFTYEAPEQSVEDDQFDGLTMAPREEPEDAHDDWPEIAPWNHDAPGSNTHRQSFDDALIEEKTRIDAAVPSWLFDDLDTDLAHHGSGGSDAVDRFHQAKPVSRPSALDRLLAEEDEPIDDHSSDERGGRKKPKA